MKKKDEWTPKMKKTLGIAVIVLAVVVSAAACYWLGRPMVRFASQPELFRVWIEEKELWGPVAYMGMVIFQVLIAIIPGEPLEIVGGYAFGAIEGTLLCLVASTVGSILVFALVRRFGIRLVEIFYPREKLRNIRFLKSSPKRTLLFLIVFMIPGTPKDMLCYFAGLTDMRFGHWLLICSLGRIPSIITSTLGGNALGTESYLFAIIVFAIALGISGGGILLYNHICKKNQE